MERRSIELADTVICGSAHLLGWMRDAGYALPTRAFVWPNVFPAPDPDPAAVEARAARDGARLDEVVFFGRLEPRKGLVLFADALARLVRQQRAPARVTFLGKPAGNFDGLAFIRRATRHWPIDVQTRIDCGAAEAVAYLSQPGRLAVIPSLLENASIAVTECLQAGIPFVAAATGGTPELIAPEDHGRALVPPDHLALGDRIAALATAPLRPVQPHRDFQLALDVWQRWHAQTAAFAASAERFTARARDADSGTPTVTVCIVHHERPALLRTAADSVLAQDYPALDAVLVDDGSESPEARAAVDAIEADFSPRSWRVIRQDNRYLGAARNAAVAAARGDWVLFLDDDNVLFPDAVSRLTRAARFSGADCVPAASIRFTGDGDPRKDTASHGAPIRFLGAARAWNRLSNVVGDACALLRREAFEAVGGFTEVYGVGLEDLELFNRLIEAGWRIEPFPEPVYYYRTHPGTSMIGMMRDPYQAEVCRAPRPRTVHRGPAGRGTRLRRLHLPDHRGRPPEPHVRHALARRRGSGLALGRMPHGARPGCVEIPHRGAGRKRPALLRVVRLGSRAGPSAGHRAAPQRPSPRADRRAGPRRGGTARGGLAVALPGRRAVQHPRRRRRRDAGGARHAPVAARAAGNRRRRQPAATGDPRLGARPRGSRPDSAGRHPRGRPPADDRPRRESKRRHRALAGHPWKTWLPLARAESGRGGRHDVDRGLRRRYRTSAQGIAGSRSQRRGDCRRRWRMSGDGAFRAAILVAGMHRSGTSALARVLTLAGCALPRTLVQPKPDNVTGFWESQAVVDLNEEILAAVDSSWDDWRPFPRDWHASPAAGAFRERARELLRQEFGDSRLFVLKDPRICRLLAFWIEAVRACEAKPLVAVTVRSPLGVAASLEARNGIDPFVGYLSWLRHVLDAEAGSRGLPRVFVRYESLLSEPHAALDRIRRTLGIEWPNRSSPTARTDIDAFLSPELRHHRSGDDEVASNPHISGWIRATFAIVERWTRDDSREEDEHELDRTGAAFEDATPAFDRALATSTRAMREVRILSRTLEDARRWREETARALEAERRQHADAARALRAERRQRARMTLVRRAGRFGRRRLDVQLTPEWLALARRRPPADPGLELRRNGRVLARIDAGDVTGDTLSLPIGAPARAFGDTLFSLHDGATGSGLAVLVEPPLWRAWRLLGAVEPRARLEVRGWAIDRRAPEQRRHIAIYIAGRLQAIVVAENMREDIGEWQGSGGRHGFLWAIAETAAVTAGTRVDVFDADTGRPLRGSPAHVTGDLGVAPGGGAP